MLRPAQASQRGSVALGEEHRNAFVAAGPAHVAGAAIAQMRRQQNVEAVLPNGPLQGHEADMLQDDLALGIREHRLLDAVATARARVDEVIGGTPSSSMSTALLACRFSSEKKSAPSVTISPRSRVHA